MKEPASSISVTDDLGNPNPEFSEKRIRNFWKKVDKTLNPAGCWMWSGMVDKDGYGKLETGTRKFGTVRKWRAHRYCFVFLKGDIPAGAMIMHTCDTPGCVNPDHLVLGDALSNNRDRDQKGRGHKLRGEQIMSAKVTEAQVVEMRALYRAGVSQHRLAIRFSICQSTVSTLVNRKHWRHVQ